MDYIETIGPHGMNNKSDTSNGGEMMNKLFSLLETPDFGEYIDRLKLNVVNHTKNLSNAPNINELVNHISSTLDTHEFKAYKDTIISTVLNDSVGSGIPSSQEIENPYTKDQTAKDDEKSCSVCMINIKNTVLLPCRHQSTCHTCSEKLKTCPICREKIEDLVVAYIS